MLGGNEGINENRDKGFNSEKAAGKSGETKKFLSFFLGTEEYGIDIVSVHEIIGVLPITSIPYTSNFIKGVINLRGKIIPVIDLRLKFEMSEAEYTEETCIIVTQSENLQVGVIVDKVSEVLDISPSQIEDVPSFGIRTNIDYLLGICNIRGGVKLLLDIDNVLSSKAASA
ncbi:MAG: purine-binding chemotaxis protein CheW [Candidatus Schekmanbacteria bacterium]|nr:purine-binding chemotaxis protein CheW [Candidatus Schekmanbacteria bacterium]